METFAILFGIAVALGAASGATSNAPKPKAKLVHFKGEYKVRKPIWHETWWVDEDGTRHPGKTWER